VIHVDTRRLGRLLPPGWRQKAAEAQRELDLATTPKQRAEILKKKRLWGDLNKILREASGDKCWYSESRERASRMDIDHFRPKGAVRESDGTTRPGYPFLAYDFRNYRLSAQLMNQRTGVGDEGRGKHQQFPLRSGFPGATDVAGIGGEKALLLDPTVPRDPGLLTFDEEGRAKPSVSEARDRVGRERAERTVDVLWLDRPELGDGRKAAWAEAHGRIVRAERLKDNALRLTAAGNRAEAEEEWGHFRDELGRLRKALAPTSEFSAAVGACLRACGRRWALRMAKRAARRSLQL
jgi:hypothetical protein